MLYVFVGLWGFIVLGLLVIVMVMVENDSELWFLVGQVDVEFNRILLIDDVVVLMWFDDGEVVGDFFLIGSDQIFVVNVGVDVISMIFVLESIIGDFFLGVYLFCVELIGVWFGEDLWV